MDATLTLWLVCGAVAVLAMMLVAVGLARRLDRDAQSEKFTANKLASIASRMKGAGGLAAAAGPVVALLAHANAEAKSGGDDEPGDPKAKQAKALITGLAVAGGILMVIVGIITGDN